MIDTTMPTVTLASRAALRRVEAGNLAICAQCGQQVKFAAKQNRQQVIANVYVKGKWDRVEHFHDECYDLAGTPFGPVS
jgi:RNA polymerase-binding transcription factor DksA